MSLVSEEQFQRFLDSDNSGGLEAVWRRASGPDRERLLMALRNAASHSQTTVFLRALLGMADTADRERLMALGLEALSDLASAASNDRTERLAKWARVVEVREALLATAALRGADVSNDLVDWLGSTDDDAFADALIPIFLAAVERRDGARLHTLEAFAARLPLLAPVHLEYERLRSQSRAEWRSFVESLRLVSNGPFTATIVFHAASPLITLRIDPQRLNWFVLRWDEHEADSTRRLVDGVPVETTGPLEDLPRHLHAAMRARGLSASVDVRVQGSAVVREAVLAWATTSSV